MGKKKKETMELRFYEVPQNEYVLALLGWQLAQLRREHIVNKKRDQMTTQDKMNLFQIRAPKRVTIFN